MDIKVNVKPPKPWPKVGPPPAVPRRPPSTDYLVDRFDKAGERLSLNEIADLVRLHAVDSETLVWNEDLTDWTPISRVPNLRVLIQDGKLPSPWPKIAPPPKPVNRRAESRAEITAAQ